jgi:hypothetical protein
MARWQTDTMLFRRALALVALWCLLWAVLGYLQHRAVPSYDQRPGYRESMQACADPQLLSSRAGDFTARRPGRWEMSACTGRVRGDFLAAERAQHRQITLAVLAWALLPSLLLLLLAASAAQLRRLLPPRDPGRG